MPDVLLVRALGDAPTYIATLPDTVDRATLQVCSTNQQPAAIDGLRVGDVHLAPDAHEGPHYDAVLATLLRSQAKTPGEHHTIPLAGA